MPRATALMYEAADTERKKCAVMELGMIVARAHHTDGLPWDTIALEMGWWYPAGLTERDLEEFGNEHRKMSERRVSPQQVMDELRPLFAMVKEKVLMAEAIAQWWRTS